MRSTTLAFSALCSLAAAASSSLAVPLHGWSNATVITTGVTVTGYTTYCPVPTVVTVTTCSDHKCAPETITASEATTITITGEVLVPTTIATSLIGTATTSVHHGKTVLPTALAMIISALLAIVTVSEASTVTFTGECVVPTSVTSDIATSAESTVYTTGVTVTGYTTYCPSPTEFTISTCNDHKCAPSIVTVSEASTLTFTGECVVPTSVTSEIATSAESTVYTTGVTVTGYTTYCPSPTEFTISTCNDNECTPAVVTVSEASTLTFTGEYIIPTTITSAVSKSASIVPTESTVYTTGVTVTGYTTYCPTPTVVTLATCSDSTCVPEIVTVSEASTLTFSGEYVVPTTITSAVSISTEAEYTSLSTGTTVYTTGVTVTGYTTYYPFPTVVTASTCSGDECAPEIVTVSGASTLTFTGEYLVPSSVTSAFVSTLVTKSTEATSAPASVTIHTGGAGKAVAGAAGFVGLLALLI
ncbi:hypothetical protein OXX69_005058 [Metschnikowia pulcherrima]